MHVPSLLSAEVGRPEFYCVLFPRDRRRRWWVPHTKHPHEKKGEKFAQSWQPRGSPIRAHTAARTNRIGRASKAEGVRETAKGGLQNMLVLGNRWACSHAQHTQHE